MLKPELQDEGQYADSLLNLVEAEKLWHRDISRMVVSNVRARPKRLLEIMAKESWEGKGSRH